MEIQITTAGKEDIPEFVRMRIAYMKEDMGDLIVFVAKEGDHIVSTAYLLVVEMPANADLLNGFYGNVLSVYTEPEYRGRGLCTAILQKLIACGRDKKLSEAQ